LCGIGNVAPYAMSLRWRPRLGGAGDGWKTRKVDFLQRYLRQIEFNSFLTFPRGMDIFIVFRLCVVKRLPFQPSIEVFILTADVRMPLVV
jgi:hypothetical protein